MKRTLGSLAVILMAGMLLLGGCAKQSEESMTPEPAPVAQGPTPEEIAAQKAAEEKAAADALAAAKRAEEEKAEQERAAKAAAGPKPIYFDFDRSFIRDDAKAIMKANAQWLKANPKVKVRIEGNCDERGTIEYNQALGQRRAAAAKKYLTDLGVSSKRISLISYGKEKPICTQSNEDCWQQNRRADFVTGD